MPLQNGVPWTSDDVDQFTQQLIDHNAAEEDRELTDGDFAFDEEEWLKSNVNNVAYLTIVRDDNDAAVSGTVVWPDGTEGTYTADEVSTDFLGAVDAYHITYEGETTRTVTQPAVTRDPGSGAVTAQPELEVS